MADSSLVGRARTVLEPVASVCRGAHGRGSGVFKQLKGMNYELSTARKAGVTQPIARSFASEAAEHPEDATPEKVKIGYRGVNPLFRLPVGYYDGCPNKNRKQRRRVLQRELFKRLEAQKRKEVQKSATEEKERKKLVRWQKRAAFKADWIARRAASNEATATTEQ
eukprot:CAMPEP_0118935304 /NCGR_PEP_ID=MMETSP1169-20130426/15381_1 /TAXON_ID=36882 /ORGANISM="Pyramimonas obovata, Strain CCMP722" /LENGTH=165 /DNA_ID=CAMNT_0006878321 /DNA_START=262 /DNA_END=759 /DNA_ORIENTATION=-